MTIPTAQLDDPRGAKNAQGPRHALSVDVEDYYMVLNFRRRISASEWDSFPSRVVQNTRRLLAIFEAAEVKATFFTLGVVAEKHPELVREIAASGHEVASHGWSHAPFTELDRLRAAVEVLRSKQLLEDISGQEILGYRAPSFSIRPDTLWALDVLREAGYRYDSSIFPTRHPDYGIPDAPRAPGPHPTPAGESLLEFPMTVAPFLGRELPVSGGGWFRLFPLALTRAGFRRVEAAGRPGVFYLHPWEVDPDQPDLRDRTSRLGAFRHYVNLKRTVPRLEALLRSFSFGPLKEVLAATGHLEG